MVSSDCNGSFEGDCCLKWESCHTESKLCERKQLHNEALTVVHTVNLVTPTASVPAVYFIVFCGYYITNVLSVIKAPLSMHVCERNPAQQCIIACIQMSNSCYSED